MDMIGAGGRKGGGNGNAIPCGGNIPNPGYPNGGMGTPGGKWGGSPYGAGGTPGNGNIGGPGMGGPDDTVTGPD
jgi:hypothetical protein